MDRVTAENLRGVSFLLILQEICSLKVYFSLMTYSEFNTLEENERWEILWDKGRYLFDSFDGTGMVLELDGIIVIVEFDSQGKAKRITDYSRSE